MNDLPEFGCEVHKDYSIFRSQDVHLGFRPPVRVMHKNGELDRCLMTLPAGASVAVEACGCWIPARRGSGCPAARVRETAVRNADGRGVPIAMFECCLRFAFSLVPIACSVFKTIWIPDGGRIPLEVARPGTALVATGDRFLRRTEVITS